MSERTLKRLVGALVVLIVVWGIATLLSGRGGAPGASAELASFFDGVSEESLTAVRMGTPDEAIELRREGDGWTVNGHATDSGSVARFWNDLAAAEIGGLVASNPANHARMGVSADSAARFELDLGDDTRVLFVGDQGSRYGTSYVRLPEADDVYVLDSNLRPHVVRSLANWRNKRMAAIDTSAVHRLEVRRDEDRYALVRGDTAWTFEDGGATSGGGVRNILMELRDVRAAGFLEEADSLAMLEEGASVVALGAEGDTLVSVTLGVGEGDRWARVEGNPVLYSVSSFRADRMAPTQERVTGS